MSAARSTITLSVSPELDRADMVTRAAGGAHIALICQNMVRVHDELLELAGHVAALDNCDGVKVYRSNGREAIRFPGGGRIVVRSWRWWGESVRGMAADRVYLYELDIPSPHLFGLVENAGIAVCASDDPAIIQVTGRADGWAWPTPPLTIGQLVAERP